MLLMTFLFPGVIMSSHNTPLFLPLLLKPHS
jgi:hypothetical protein